MRVRRAIVGMLGAYCIPTAHFRMNAHFLTGEQSFIDEGRDLLATGAWLP